MRQRHPRTDPPIAPRILMWGYLPAASPQRNPLHHPVLVPPSLAGENWASICAGGCGFALAVSETGKLNTWGSTDDFGQNYVTSGKNQERPEPFSLQSEAPIVLAAAGWAHCAAVTDSGEVYTWGWKECVPTGKSAGEPITGASSEKDLYENQHDGKEKIEEGPVVGARFNEQFDYPESSHSTSSETALKAKGNIGPLSIKLKGCSTGSPSQSDRLRAGFSSPSGKSPTSKSIPRVSSGGNVAGFEKSSDDGTKRRRLATAEQASSPESSSTGADENVSAPPCLVSLHPGVKIISVATGGRHTLALSDTGQVWGWGYGGEGQLGLGSRIRTVSSPHPVACMESVSPYWQEMHAGASKAGRGSDNSIAKAPGVYVKAIACGGRHSAVITDAGALLTFGWGLYGQCGQGSTEDELSPCHVESLGGLQVTSVAAGLWHTVCITSTGDVYSFGGNQFGQLGTGNDQAETFPRLVEAPILENQHAISVSCGARHTAVCTDTGKIFCWGWNKYGQLGLGDALDRNIPVEVGLEDSFARDVACGWWHTLALVHAR